MQLLTYIKNNNNIFKKQKKKTLKNIRYGWESNPLPMRHPGLSRDIELAMSTAHSYDYDVDNNTISAQLVYN